MAAVGVEAAVTLTLDVNPLVAVIVVVVVVARWRAKDVIQLVRALLRMPVE
jgi:hypothetical protein